MRSIWNGAISFGLVSIPIKLVNATENHNVSFRQIHTEDGGRIRYRKVCELEDKEVSQSEIGKAYEESDGSMIPITDEDLQQLPIPTAKTIEIVAFVPSERIDPMQMESAYYLAAGGAQAAKPYTLLREALKRSNKVAIAKFALRGRERLGMLRVVEEAIVMHGLLWPDEIRQPAGVAPEGDVKIRDQELDLADALMDTLGEVDMDDLHDEYREAVEEMVAAKASGQEAPALPEAPAGGGKVLDLMAALENSVRAAQESRGESGEVREMNRSRTTPKDTSGKKSTSTAAKKTTAKKTASSRAGSGGSGSGSSKKSTSSGSGGKKAAAKKTPAKKAASRKRSA